MLKLTSVAVLPLLLTAGQPVQSAPVEGIVATEASLLQNSDRTPVWIAWRQQRIEADLAAGYDPNTPWAGEYIGRFGQVLQLGPDGFIASQDGCFGRFPITAGIVSSDPSGEIELHPDQPQAEREPRLDTLLREVDWRGEHYLVPVADLLAFVSDLNLDAIGDSSNSAGSSNHYRRVRPKPASASEPIDRSGAPALPIGLPTEVAAQLRHAAIRLSVIDAGPLIHESGSCQRQLRLEGPGAEQLAVGIQLRAEGPGRYDERIEITEAGAQPRALWNDYGACEANDPDQPQVDWTFTSGVYGMRQRPERGPGCGE